MLKSFIRCAGAAALLATLHHTLPAQVVKTWSITTGDLKKKEKPSGTPEAAGGASECETNIKHAIDAANAMFNLKSDIANIYYYEKVSAATQEKIKANMALLDAYLPEQAAYPAKAEAMIGISDKCQGKGQTYLNDDTEARLRSHGADMQAALQTAIGDLEEIATEATSEAGASDGLFVEEGDSDSDPAAAMALVEKGRVGVKILRAVMPHYPQAQSLTARVDAANSKLDAAASKSASAREAMYVSPHHKANPGSIALSLQAMSPGEEAAKLAQAWKPGEPFHMQVYLEDQLGRYTPNGTFILDFFAGEREIGDLELWLDDDEFGKKAYFGLYLFGATAADNVNNVKAKEDDLKEFFNTFARITPQRHEITLKLRPRDGKYIASGKIAFDLTGQPTGEASWFSQAAKAIDTYKEQARRDQIFSYFEFKNKLNDPTLKTKVEAAIVAESKGRIKAARVFFTDDRWTAYVNGAGMAEYRSIFFEFIIETTDGKWYVGDDLVSQDGLLGGGFDTKQVSPAYTPFDQYTDDFKDLWDHNNHGTGMFQIQVKKEQITPFWK